jgi:broad specificity phosphatase PhoE
MKKVILIRHAESIANIGGKTSLPDVIELSEAGHRQASNLITSIQERPDLIITSAYIRTLQTAKPLLIRYPHVPHEQWPVHEFTYLSLTKCRNTTTEDRIPLAINYWNQCDPDYIDGNGAESFTDFIERVRSVQQKARLRPEMNIIIFSHNLFISAWAWLQERAKISAINSHDMENFRQYLFTHPINNCHITEYINSP